MNGGRTSRSRGTVAVALMAAAALASGGGDALAGDRLVLAHGEIWRLWTAHVAHFSASHALWSGLVWLAAGAWMEREDRRGWWWLVLAGAPLVTLAALAGDGEMGRYGGLSGLACAPLAWAAWRLFGESGRERRVAGAAVFALLALKVASELLGNGTTLARFGAEADEVRPAVWAHVAGVVIGMALAARRGGSGAGAKAGRDSEGAARVAAREC